MKRTLIACSLCLYSFLSFSASHEEKKSGRLEINSSGRPVAEKKTSTRFYRINLGPEVPFERFKSVLLAAEGEEPTFRIVHSSPKHRFFLVETEQDEKELKELFTDFFPALSKHIETIKLETTLSEPEIPQEKNRPLFRSIFGN